MLIHSGQDTPFTEMAHEGICALLALNTNTGTEEFTAIFPCIREHLLDQFVGLPRLSFSRDDIGVPRPDRVAYELVGKESPVVFDDLHNPAFEDILSPEGHYPFHPAIGTSACRLIVTLFATNISVPSRSSNVTFPDAV